MNTAAELKAAPAAAAAEAGVAHDKQVEIRVPKVERLVVESDILVLDTGMFDHMTRIAKLMASSSLVPTHLNAVRTVGGVDVNIEPGEAVANCFLVVNQALRWKMDPFAVAQLVYITKGRIGYEGKLIAAVINSHPAIERRLSYAYDGTGQKRRVIVSAKLRGDDEIRTIEGTVEAWKTTGAGSPWTKESQWDQQLSYRGAREWARRHMPEAIMGVLGDDELEQFSTPGTRIEETGAADRSGAAKLKTALSAGAAAVEKIEDAEVLSETAKGAAGAPATAPAAAPAAAAPAATQAQPAAAATASKPEEKPVTQPAPPPKQGEAGTPELKAKFLAAFKATTDSEVLSIKMDEVNFYVWIPGDKAEIEQAYRARMNELDA